MQITDEDRGDVRAGTWGAAVLGGLLVLGLLLHGHLLLYALVAVASTLIGTWLARIAYMGFVSPLASAAGRIAAHAAGEEWTSPRMVPRMPSPSMPHESVPRMADPQRAPRPTYTAVTRCGCGAAVEVNALVPGNAQRTVLTAFFESHQICMARALAQEPGALPTTSTITCTCGEQIVADVIETSRDEMMRLADVFIAEHRLCAERLHDSRASSPQASL